MAINNGTRKMTRETLLASIWTITTQLFDSVTPEIAMAQFGNMSNSDLQKVYNGLEHYALLQYTKTLVQE